MKQHNPRRDWPETKKAKVYADSCYICFGVRFGTVKQIQENNMKKTICTLKETTANTAIKPDLQAALRQMTIGKNANAGTLYSSK